MNQPELNAFPVGDTINQKETKTTDQSMIGPSVPDLEGSLTSLLGDEDLEEDCLGGQFFGMVAGPFRHNLIKKWQQQQQQETRRREREEKLDTTGRRRSSIQRKSVSTRRLSSIRASWSEREILDIHVMPDLDDEIPLLLTPEMMKVLQKNMPMTVQSRSWVRCFSLERDGDLFDTFLDATQDYVHTLVVVETSNGRLLGGFVSATWENHRGSIDSAHGSFYGSGQSFLFSIGEDHQVQVFKWTGDDDCFQYCSSRQGVIGMGSGTESFGLLLAESFTRGSSAACKTYGNKSSLLNDGQEDFEIYSMEVYGFVHSW